MYFIDKADGSYHSTLKRGSRAPTFFLHLNTCIRAGNLWLIFLFILLILLTFINPISQSCLLLLFKLLDCLQGFQTQRSCTSLYYRMHKAVRDFHWQYRTVTDFLAVPCQMMPRQIREGSITSPRHPGLAPSSSLKAAWEGKSRIT